MRKCDYCNQSILESVKFCPYCGRKQPKTLSEFDLGKNPYEILQIPENASATTIERSYKNLAKQYHPDVCTERDAAEKIRLINWAYGILSNNEKRREWDRHNQKSKDELRSNSNIRSESNRPNYQQDEDSIKPSRSPQYKDSGVVKTDQDDSMIPVVGIVVTVMISFIILTAFIKQQNKPVESSSSSSFSQETPRPSSTVVRSPTETSTPNPLEDCIKWDLVSEVYVGRNTCVYGEIVKHYDTPEYAHFVRYSEAAGTFLLRGESEFLRDAGIGKCVIMKGIIYRTPSYLYISLDDPLTEVTYLATCK